MSTVIYARVPDSLKQALSARARERGLSLTAAVVALLERGLDGSEDERAGERERELEASAAELERTRARLAEAELRLQAAQEREEMIARTYGALAERARGELALCPQCRKPLPPPKRRGLSKTAETGALDSGTHRGRAGDVSSPSCDARTGKRLAGSGSTMPS